MVLVDVDIGADVDDWQVIHSSATNYSADHSLSNGSWTYARFGTPAQSFQGNRAFFLFKGITIPQGSTIDDATLTLKEFEKSFGSPNIPLSIRAVNNSAPTNLADYTTGTGTNFNTAVLSPAVTFTVTTTVATNFALNVQPHVQALVDAFDYNNDNMLFRMAKTPVTTTTQQFDMQGFEHQVNPPTSVANLTINYSAGTPTETFIVDALLKALGDNGCSTLFQEDFSSSVGWVQTGTQVTISGGTLNGWGPSGTDESQIYDLQSNNGITLSDTRWVAEFKFKYTANASSSGQTIISLADSSGDISAGGIPNAQFRTNKQTGPDPIVNGLLTVDDGVSSFDSTGIGLDSFINTDLFVRLERLSTTQFKLSITTDLAHQNNIAGSPVTLTEASFSNITGLDHIQSRTSTGGSAFRDITGTVDDLVINAGCPTFSVDAILATIAFGNDLTWQYREHRTNAIFPPRMTWIFGGGRLRMFTTGASVGQAYTLKVFKLSEIIGSDIKVTWERNLGNSGGGVISVYDGTINAESLVDIPDLGSIPNTLLGSFTHSAFFALHTDTLLASNINYAGATGTHLTVVITNTDGNASSEMALFINDLDVTLRGKWDFTGGLVITDVRGTQDTGVVDVDDFGYINANSVTPPPLTLNFTINAILRARSCSPWKKFSEADGSSISVTINAGDAQGSEIPPVTVPTQVTGIKCSIASASTQGSVKMRIANFPQSQLANGNFITIPNGTSTNSVLMASLTGSFTDFTFLFSGAVLEPNQRYMIIFDDLIGNAPGMSYKTILTSTRDYKEYAITYQDPGSGTPPKFARVINRNRAPAVDIEVVNESGLVCPLVDALLVAEDAWEFREQRFSNANLIKPPNFTLGTEPPRLKVSAPINSDGRAWLFKSFKKTDITGNSILIEGDGLQETRIRVYDGQYKRQYFGDFEPVNNNDPVTPLDGIGLLGFTSANPLTTSLTLGAGSINYAGSTEEFITVMISCRQNNDALVAELNISAITISPFLKWNFSNPTVVTESTDPEVAFGFTRASSTQVPFMETEFAIDACLGLFSGRRSIIGDLIVKALQANPSGLTGLQIVTEVILFRPTAKTSRIKNWIGFLDTRGVIQDDGSSPDWYKTVWTLVP